MFVSYSCFFLAKVRKNLVIAKYPSDYYLKIWNHLVAANASIPLIIMMRFSTIRIQIGGSRDVREPPLTYSYSGLTRNIFTVLLNSET